MFSLLYFHSTLLFLLFVFFSLDSLKQWRTVNTHVNQPVKLLSPPIPVDSPYSHHVITEVSRKPKHALLTFDFRIHIFRTRFPSDQILALLGMRTMWFHIFINFSSLRRPNLFDVHISDAEDYHSNPVSPQGMQAAELDPQLNSE